MSTSGASCPKNDLSESEIRKERLVSLAVQASHDIRSPVAALEIAISADKTLKPENRDLLRAIALRIREISDTILSEYAGFGSPIEVVNIGECLASVVREKKLEYTYLKHVTIQFDGSAEIYDQMRIAVMIDRGAFKTAISNLINNSIAAVSHRIGALIQISFEKSQYGLEIKLSDNGRGMDAHALSQFGQKKKIQVQGAGLSLGLGCSQAKACVESAGGRMSVHSTLGKGTVIQINLPCRYLP